MALSGHVPTLSMSALGGKADIPDPFAKRLNDLPWFDEFNFLLAASSLCN